jgi:hypothetical protein
MRSGWLIGISLFLFAGCGGRNGASRADLSALASPILFRGDSVTAYRDPAVLYHEGRFHLFFTRSEIVGDSVYSYTATSESEDLIRWTEPRRIVPNLQTRNFSGPGSVIRFRDEWLLCVHSYPRPGYTVGQMPRYGDASCRLYLLRSKDLVNWSEPELMRVKGDVPEAEMGRMIDPFLVQDKDDPEKWWCFFKQNGISMSYSYDLLNWTWFGNFQTTSERPSVLKENNEYFLFHSPSNGIRIKKSRSLQSWADWDGLITLGQAEWPWARGRVSAATVVDLTNVRGIDAYLMFFHGSGPLTEREGDFDRNASIGIAWSHDLLHWQWPGKPAEGGRR